MNDSERDLYLAKGLTIIREFSMGGAGVKQAVTSSPLIECMRSVFTQLNSNMVCGSLIMVVVCLFVFLFFFSYHLFPSVCCLVSLSLISL
jgi:hypothetical protein